VPGERFIDALLYHELGEPDRAVPRPDHENPFLAEGPSAGLLSGFLSLFDWLINPIAPV
jgi:hypothetical protein